MQTKKTYRAEYGLSSVQRQRYFVGWKGKVTKTFRAFSDEQAEFLARFEDAPIVPLKIKYKPGDIYVVGPCGPEPYGEAVKLTLVHLYEITNRKVF